MSVVQPPPPRFVPPPPPAVVPPPPPAPTAESTSAAPTLRHLLRSTQALDDSGSLVRPPAALDRLHDDYTRVPAPSAPRSGRAQPSRDR